MAIVGNSLQIPMAVLMQIIVILLPKYNGVHAKKNYGNSWPKKEQQLVENSSWQITKTNLSYWLL